MMGDKISRQHFNHALNNALSAYDRSLSDNAILIDADDLGAFADILYRYLFDVKCEG
ncbi:hypothetical protein [Bifidobacterium pseudocatenulatum]|jgi:hypothetical protein|uniref:hypothetical protein n=1 Tax=Bifidobacterium pseudocatenulatum TaxID=28026 RepID=UPI0022E48594|nr:hypothetical protein [Bifidobacterium pseudocatenulatum]